MLARTYAMAGSPRPDIAAEAIRLYEEGDRDPLATDPRNLHAKELVWAGELAAARVLLDTVWAEVGGVGSELQRMQALYDRSLLETACGAFDEVARLVDRGREMAIDSEETDGIAKFDGVGAGVAVWRGDVDRALAVIERLLGERELKSRDTPIRMHWMRGLLMLSRGEPRGALADLEAALELLEVAWLRHPGLIPVLPDAVEAAAGGGDGAHARELLALLDERAARIDTPWTRAIRARSRGAVLLADGEPEDAVTPLRGALATFDATGHRPDAARAALLLGRCLLRAGHRSAAAEALDDARARAEQLGAVLWEAQCRQELARVAPGRAEGSLTPTERRIAQLVADGARNKEIASALFVSTANVEAHLTRIFRKLGIRTRSDLVRWMAADRGGGPAATPDGEGL
jgi:DNA-binding CsgD family transcriptional regulator